MPEDTENTASDDDQTQDTVEADGDDTLAADASQDTVVADDSQDTVAADAGDESVFQQFDEPAPKAADTPAGRQADTIAAAGDDDELVELEREAAEIDESIGTPGKFSKIVKRLADRDRRKDATLKQVHTRLAAAEHDSAWNRLEDQLGLNEAPAEVRRALPRRILKERFAKHFKAAMNEGASEDEARGEARATLKAEARTIIQQHKTKKPAPRIKTDAAGARLSPPGGGQGGRTTKPKLTPEEEFDQGTYVN